MKSGHPDSVVCGDAASGSGGTDGSDGADGGTGGAATSVAPWASTACAARIATKSSMNDSLDVHRDLLLRDAQRPMVPRHNPPEWSPVWGARSRG